MSLGDLPLSGCIADDFTGGTDLAGILVKAGMRTVQTVGVPQGGVPAGVDAIVVALKSHTISAPEAVQESLAAMHWLQKASCRQFYCNYCPTFDSTAQGNIGPVAEALLGAQGAEFTIACPAFPANQRAVYQGPLFAVGALLSESGMQDHPLTPMRDADLVRVLQLQVAHPVGLVDQPTVAQGPQAIGERMDVLRQSGHRFASADAITDSDLMHLGRACAAMPLVTGSSGLAMGLPANFRRAGVLGEGTGTGAGEQSMPLGRRAVVPGSCSSATLRQVARMQESHPSFCVEPAALARRDDVVGEAPAWADAQAANEPVLVYASATPESVQATQRHPGVQRAGTLVEGALSSIANGLVERGVTQLIVAGGEPAGAVVKRLGVAGVYIGPGIDPGVPRTRTMGGVGNGPPIALALKSGNFGGEDFFLKAWDRPS